jgi:hypothetical protein
MAEKVATEVGARMIDSSAFRVSDTCSHKACNADAPSGQGRPAYRTHTREGAPASAPKGLEFNSENIGKDILGKGYPVFRLDDQFKVLASETGASSTRDLPSAAQTVDDSGVDQLYAHLQRPLI